LNPHLQLTLMPVAGTTKDENIVYFHIKLEKSHAHRLWDFFRGLFLVSFSTIFDLFKINEDFHQYQEAVAEALKGFAPFQGCET